MSKSLGTGIDPLQEIDRHGADAVRFGLLAMSSTQDVRYSAEKVQQGQALANKLFNAVRFALVRIDASLGSERAKAVAPTPMPAAVEDRWILSRLTRALADTAARIERYDFSHAALGLYDFVYGELCDWYLEIVKQRLPDRAETDGDDRAGQELAATLLYVLRETVAMAHPLIPFVTEELWRYLDDTGDLLAGSAYPRAREDLIDLQAEDEMSRTIEAVTLVRGWRDSVGARAGLFVTARLCADGYRMTAPLLARLARLRLLREQERSQAVDAAGTSATNGDGAHTPPRESSKEDAHARGGESSAESAAVASIPIPGGTVEVLSGEGLDLGAAERRREAAKRKLLAEIERVQGKLERPGFVEKAPAAVVEGERERLGRLRAELELL
jgi:valyl-tRNA synthetase